eukprot:COSAG04_NODE_394_length_15124_cov_10.557005_1_plen_291_part_00
MAPPPRRSRRLALKRVTIGDLPEPALRAILLGPSDNLLRFVAACARVCAEWWRVVGGSAAYGRGLGKGKRASVLKAITKALEAEGEKLNLYWEFIGDPGAGALGAVLQALPTIRFTVLDLDTNDLTAAGVASLAPALRRPWGDSGLRELRVSHNPLGDAGVAALAKALPPTLEDLEFGSAGCGDAGFLAMAVALPALTCLDTLWCHENPAVGARGWAALAGALPSLPALRTIYASSSTGIGLEGARALAAAVPNCPQLRELYVDCSDLPREGAAALEAVDGEGLDMLLNE